ncbi:sporulation delaying protein family toxin [Myxococcus sp. SDU36]|uniref:sporulation delaying protein family toxin n=1 Tax=Myxococcus sp. SDU36 TaxID=2831967 RepID=UPI002542C48B|nr:sporulation delaying protein family toxin [Myxococcus sp. SDU36]WIG93252.1 sporulation delaying protein family toxin [Myxococcus sp. SDU36]
MKRSTLKLTSAVTAFMTFSTFGIGCGPADGSSGPSAGITQNQALSGQNLFKGMAFGLGPAAHYFDDLWQRPEIKAKLGDETLAKREEAAEAVIAKMSALDPAFFERFGNDLRSGNHLVIDQLLTDTRELTVAAANALRKDAGQAGEINAAALQQVEVGLYLYVETAVAVAIVLILILTQIDMTPVMEGPQSSQLQRDVWVDMLAKRFAAAE